MVPPLFRAVVLLCSVLCVQLHTYKYGQDIGSLSTEGLQVPSREKLEGSMRSMGCEVLSESGNL